MLCEELGDTSNSSGSFSDYTSDDSSHDSESDSKSNSPNTGSAAVTSGHNSTAAAANNAVIANASAANDRVPTRKVAVKIIRQGSMSRGAALREVSILERLQQKYTEGARRCVRLFRTFEHRGHLCLVFEVC